MKDKEVKARPMIDVLRDLVQKWDEGYSIDPNHKLAHESRVLLKDMEHTLEALDKEIRMAKKWHKSRNALRLSEPDDLTMFG